MKWPEVPFGELARVMANGLSPSSKGSYQADVLTLSAITRGRFDPAFAKSALLDKEPGPEQLVRDSTFLVCRGNGNVGLVGAGVFGEETSDRLVFPDTIIGCQVDLMRVHRPFLQAVWRSPAVRAQLESGARTTNGTFKINQKTLSAVTVPLPPLPEQTRIAAILNKADEIRRKRQEAIRLTEELLRSAFLEMFGDPVTNPKRWEVKRLGDCFEVQLGKMLSGKAKAGVRPRPYLGNRHVQWDHVLLDNLPTMDFTEEEEQKFTLKPGDVLVCEGGEVGRAAIWRGQGGLICYQKALHRLRGTSGAVLPEFMTFYLREAAERGLFEEHTSQTSIAHLTREKLVELEIMVPETGAQRLFQAIYQRTEEALESLKSSSLLVTSLARTLEQQAFRREL